MIASVKTAEITSATSAVAVITAKIATTALIVAVSFANSAVIVKTVKIANTVSIAAVKSVIFVVIA